MSSVAVVPQSLRELTTIAMLTHDPRFASEIAELLDEATFDPKSAFYNVVKIAREYAKEFKAPIGSFALRQALCPVNPATGSPVLSPSEEKLRQDIITELDTVYETQLNGLEESFLRRIARTWIESHRQAHIAMLILEGTETNGDPEETRKLFHQGAIAPLKAGDRPLYYSAIDPQWNIEIITRRMEDKKPRSEIFTSGYEALDNEGIYPRPGKLFLFVCATGFGKTWQAVNLSKYFAERRIPQLVITFELTEEDYMKRVYQAMFALIDKDFAGSLAEPTITVPVFADGSNNITSQVVKLEWLQSPAARRRINNWFNKQPITLPSGTVWNYGHAAQLLIRQFQSLTETPESISQFIERILEDLPQSERPRVLILDHMSDLAQSGDKGKPRWAAKGDDIRELRALAVRYNMAVYTSSQTNMQGFDADEVTGKHIDESHQKLQACDIAITFSRTELEEKIGCGRGRVIKGRSVKQGLRIKILQSIISGQWCLDSRIVGAGEAVDGKKWHETVMRHILEDGETLQQAADAVQLKRDTIQKHLKVALAPFPGKYEEVLKRG